MTALTRSFSVVACLGTLACANEIVPSTDVALTTLALTSASGVETKVFQAPGTKPFAAYAATLRAEWQRDVSVELFYPKEGQMSDGWCWQGLLRDRQGQLYPIASGNLVQLSATGEILAGLDDQDYFVSDNSGASWGVLDAKQKKVYSAVDLSLRSAPFESGSAFTELVGELSGSAGVAMGRGPLLGSVLVAESFANRITRIELSSLASSVLAQSDALATPGNIVSAPGGAVYVVAVGVAPARLLKVTPRGEITTFAEGEEGKQTQNGLAVDTFGRVYWSNATGINVYGRDGDLITKLPLPPDITRFGNPMGMQLDRAARYLYVVDNFACKRIYKYTLPRCLHVADAEPGALGSEAP